MRGTGRARGSAAGGAPFVLAALLLAALVPVAHADPLRADRRPLRFGGLVWDATSGDVVRGLQAEGFERAPGRNDDAEWRGHAFGEWAIAAPAYDSAGRLVEVKLRFEPRQSLGEVQRYQALVTRMRHTFGPWAERIAPGGRPARAEDLGRYGLPRGSAPPAVATLWTRPAGAAAAALLDVDGVLWVRFRSPRANAAQAADSALGR